MEIKDQLAALQTELKGFLDKAAVEQKNHGTMLEETKSTIVKLQTQVDAMDVKMAHKMAVEQGQGSTLIKTFQDDEGLQRLLRDRKGHAVIKVKGSDVSDLMERKSIISAVTAGTANGDALNPVGTATTGVLPIDRIPGITAEARQVLKIRNLFTQRPTTMQVIDYVRVNTPMSIASPVPEASLKPENQLTFNSLSERVKLLATWIPATRQVLDDFTELMSFIQTSLPYYVNLEEELQILLGDNAGEDLHGIVPQAITFNTSYLPFSSAQGWNKMDIIASAISQIMAAKEIPPTFVVLNPVDWWAIRLTKDGFGRYIINPDPQAMSVYSLFGLDVVATTSMPVGQFLVGSGNPVAAEIRDRMEMTVEVSTEHADYFVRNLVAIRAEKRLAFICKRPASFVSGTFATSPVTPA
jgi:HK97 family phage major capsid protein